MLSDGIVLTLQDDATYSSLVAAKSTVPVGMVKNVVYPLVVYHLHDVTDVLDFNGSTGNRRAMVQLDCYSAKSMLEARTVSKAVREVFQNFNNVTLPDADATFVQAVYITNESDQTMIPQGIQTVEYRILVELEVFYLES
jgi:hypothetical protein